MSIKIETITKIYLTGCQNEPTLNERDIVEIVQTLPKPIGEQRIVLVCGTLEIEV